MLIIAIVLVCAGCTGSICVCISPLTALMMDQQSKFASLGLLVEYVGESQNDKSVIQRVLHGQVQLVYITPENIMDNPMYRNMLLSNIYREKLVGLIVDEAHCVKLWGDQFRISFSKIGNLRSIVPSTVNS